MTMSPAWHRGDVSQLPEQGMLVALAGLTVNTDNDGNASVRDHPKLM